MTGGFVLWSRVRAVAESEVLSRQHLLVRRLLL